MIIEIPKITDYIEINNLAKQVHRLHVKWRPDLYLDIDEVIKKEDLKEKIQSNEIIVAKMQNNIVGYVTFNIQEKNNPIMRYRKQLQIEAICVDENNRCKGIGTELLKYLKNIAKEKKCTDMHLTVNKENINAIKVYEKFGFRVKSIVYTLQI